MRELVINYSNTEENYIELMINKEYCSKKHWAKDIMIRVLVIILFSYLCYKKYSIDIDLFGYLTEGASPVILVYILCGVLWVILLPILYWKLKTLVISKEIKNMNIDFNGKVTYRLDEDKIVIEDNNIIIKSNWKQVKSITRKKKILILVIKECGEFIIPISAFSKEKEIEDFLLFINNKIEEVAKLNNQEQEV